MKAFEMQKTLRSVYFVNNKTGWVVGSEGVILHTSDGGNTWESQKSGITSDLFCVNFINEQKGWACGAKGTILHTHDGGKIWKRQFTVCAPNSNIGNNLNSIYFLDAGIDGLCGWAVGENGWIFNTENGGETWSRQSNSHIDNLNCVKFIDAKKGYATGKNGTVIFTIDGGFIWFLYKYRERNIRKIQSMCLTEKGFCLLGYSNDSQYIEFFKDIEFFREDGYDGSCEVKGSTSICSRGNGFVAVGKLNNIFLIENCITKRFEECLISATHLNSVHFADEYNGWAVGNNGIILHSENGGRNWKSQNCSIGNYFKLVTFFDKKNGLAVRWDGETLYSSDGGETWETEKS